MNADISSPAKYLMRRLYLRKRQSPIRCLDYFAMCARPIILVLILCGSMTAQQAPLAAGLASSISTPQTSANQPPDDSASTTPGASAFSSSTDDPSAVDDVAQATPNAPAPQNASGDDRAPQTKRILGIVPNFRAISTDEKLPAQSVKEKFVTASEDSFDYSSIFIPALLAGYSLETNATPEFGHGAVGYGRYLWHAAVDQTSENYMVEFVVPAVTHEDTRYYTLGRGGFLKRAGYALSRAVVTRSDSGNEVFNASEVIGAGAASGLSSLYYPSRERSFGNTGKEWGLDVGIDSASFVVKEFWPDINHWLFHAAKPTANTQQ
jgi:hypothetical protein